MPKYLFQVLFLYLSVFKAKTQPTLTISPVTVTTGSSLHMECISDVPPDPTDVRTLEFFVSPTQDRRRETRLCSTTIYANGEVPQATHCIDPRYSVIDTVFYITLASHIENGYYVCRENISSLFEEASNQYSPTMRLLVKPYALDPYTCEEGEFSIQQFSFEEDLQQNVECLFQSSDEPNRLVLLWRKFLKTYPGEKDGPLEVIYSAPIPPSGQTIHNICGTRCTMRRTHTSITWSFLPATYLDIGDYSCIMHVANNPRCLHSGHTNVMFETFHKPSISLSGIFMDFFGMTYFKPIRNTTFGTPDVTLRYLICYVNDTYPPADVIFRGTKFQGRVTWFDRFFRRRSNTKSFINGVRLTTTFNTSTRLFSHNLVLDLGYDDTYKYNRFTCSYDLYDRNGNSRFRDTFRTQTYTASFHELGIKNQLGDGCVSVGPHEAAYWIADLGTVQMVSKVVITTDPPAKPPSSTTMLKVYTRVCDHKFSTSNNIIPLDAFECGRTSWPKNASVRTVTISCWKVFLGRYVDLRLISDMHTLHVLTVCGVTVYGCHSNICGQRHTINNITYEDTGIERSCLYPGLMFEAGKNDMCKEKTWRPVHPCPTPTPKLGELSSGTPSIQATFHLIACNVVLVCLCTICGKAND